MSSVCDHQNLSILILSFDFHDQDYIVQTLGSLAWHYIPKYKVLGSNQAFPTHN